MASIKHFLGVDTGGTFTDFYYWGESGVRIHKVLSSPESPERAIVQGLRDLNLMTALRQGEVVLVHGSTVATNAALEGKGVRTVYVTNRGFADMLSLGRQNRPDIYALQPQPVPAPVPAELCLEVDCRRNPSGDEIVPLTDAAIADLVDAITTLAPEAVAINLLYSYVDGVDERRIAAALPGTWFVSCSHHVLPEYKEYERGMATWLNAWLGPRVADYLASLKNAVQPSPLSVMQSSGGTIDATLAAQKAVNLLLSGPAGGLAAAKYIGGQIDSKRLLTFDMGGTSTDVALIDGDIKLTNEGRLGGYPVAVPMVDMHTIGAGGGSLSYLDAGGLLHVGPESAGAQPGPACYGLGGLQATVTDANALLGRLRPDYFLGGRMPLDLPAAEAAMGALSKAMGVDEVATALGVIALANEHMAAALRVISVQKGYDPAEFELCCFGGAGGLHVCALAQALNMTKVLVPANGGVLSAFGMLVAPRTRQLSKSVLKPVSVVLKEDIEAIAQALIEVGTEEMAAEGATGGVTAETSVDCRYQGQSFHINLPWLDSLEALEAEFHLAHQQLYGHALSLPLELVNLRVKVALPAWSAPVQIKEQAERGKAKYRITIPELGHTEVWWRADIAVHQRVHGPAIICEEVATTLVAVGWQAQCDQFGHLRLTQV